MKTIYKYLIVAGIIIYSIILTKSFFKLQSNYRDIKDQHTTELIQKDSLQKVYEVDTRQLRSLILKQDSIYNRIIEEKDLKIKQLNSLSRIEIVDTISIHDTIISQIPTHKDTTITFIEPIKSLSITGDLTIKNNKIDLIFKSFTLNLTINIIDYHEIIYWYNFRKRKEYGYSLIGFRNHYISKVYAESPEYEDNVKINLIKVKK